MIPSVLMPRRLADNGSLQESGNNAQKPLQKARRINI